MKKNRLILTLLILTTGSLFAQENQSSVFTIDSCVQYAFKNSPYLKAKNNEVRIAAKNLGIYKSQQLPTVNASANYLLTGQYENLQEYTSTNAGIEMYQPIWQNGRLKTLIEQAKVGKQMAKVQYQIERFNLVFTISQQYLILLRQQQLELLWSEMAKRIAINVESAKERCKVGIARKSDILKAETELSNAIFTRTRYATGRKVAERTLIKTIGADLNKGIIVLNILKDTDYTYTNWELEQFYQIANENLPELKLADQSISRQSSFVKYEKKSNGPELGLNTGYSYLDSPLQNNTWYGSAGVSLNLNIFKGFERKNKIAKETIRLEQLEYEKIDLQQLVKLEIQQAYLALLETKQQIENSLKQLENSSENLKIVREEYKQGISSMLELLDAENADFVANQNYIDALSGYQMAKVAIERKSGIYDY